MRKIVLMLGIGTLLLGACSKPADNVDADSLRIANLSDELQKATDYKDSLLLLMDDIYQGMDQINQQEGLLNNLGATGDNANRREEIRQNLEVIREKLRTNRELLAQMEKKLAVSNDKNGVLTKTIENLKTQISSQETHIAQLNTELESARTKIAQLNEEVAETKEQMEAEVAEKEKAQQEVVSTTNQLNRIYYAIGTNKELKNKGLISKKFLGKTKVLEGEFDKEYFTVGDKRNLMSIPCGDKSVKIWTNHPDGSYEIIENADKTKTIKILDADKFWSVSNHLIVQVG